METVETEAPKVKMLAAEPITINSVRRADRVRGTHPIDRFA
jgi:hypothetical protein